MPAPETFQGCDNDLLFMRTGAVSQELIVVGTMTLARLFDLPKARFIGVRFRPEMSFLFVPVPGPELVDQRIPLREIWRPKANQLHEQLADCSVPQFMAQIETHLLEHFTRDPRVSLF